MKCFRLFIRRDGDRERTFLGIFTEDYCRSYCKKYGGKFDIHIYTEEVKV